MRECVRSVFRNQIYRQVNVTDEWNITHISAIRSCDEVLYFPTFIEFIQKIEKKI